MKTNERMVIYGALFVLVLSNIAMAVSIRNLTLLSDLHTQNASLSAQFAARSVEAVRILSQNVTSLHCRVYGCAKAVDQ